MSNKRVRSRFEEDLDKTVEQFLSGKDIIFDNEIINRANNYIGKKNKYQLTKDNCHSFVHKRIINEDPPVFCTFLASILKDIIFSLAFFYLYISK